MKLFNYLYDSNKFFQKQHELLLKKYELLLKKYELKCLECLICNDKITLLRTECESNSTKIHKLQNQISEMKTTLTQRNMKISDQCYIIDDMTNN